MTSENYGGAADYFKHAIYVAGVCTSFEARSNLYLSEKLCFAVRTFLMHARLL